MSNLICLLRFRYWKKDRAVNCLHLQGKCDEIEQGKGIESDIDADVIDALTSLGYGLIEAQSALQMIPKIYQRTREPDTRGFKYFPDTNAL